MSVLLSETDEHRRQGKKDRKSLTGPPFRLGSRKGVSFLSEGVTCVGGISHGYRTVSLLVRGGPTAEIGSQ